MPMPGWWRHLNKRFINPRTLKTDHNWALITHVGRKSGTSYTTPIGAIPVSGGFVTYLVYGRNTDWAKNVLAANSGFLEVDGKQYRIKRAQIMTIEETEKDMSQPVQKPPALLRVSELIRMEVDEVEQAS